MEEVHAYNGRNLCSIWKKEYRRQVGLWGLMEGLNGGGGICMGEENERIVLNFVHLNKKYVARRNGGEMSNMDKYKIFC